jgi:hypothetical protein
MKATKLVFFFFFTFSNFECMKMLMEAGGVNNQARNASKNEISKVERTLT